jgi:hypothetical protein
MDIDKCLEILGERQKKPMNKPEDMPDIEGLEIDGQAHIFDATFREGEYHLKEDTDPKIINGSSAKIINGSSGTDFSTKSAGTREDIDEKIEGMSCTELLNLVTTLQAERVQTYAEYESTLIKLVESKMTKEYPSLCSEMTTRFSVLSKYIIKAKDTLRNKFAREDLAKLVESLQVKEQEKLTTVAAMHLDILKKQVPAIAGQLSHGAYEHIDGGDYASKKIESLHIAISENLEALNMEK